ncbi:DUF4013 domain-containing protein [Methanobacterium alcaliphilum]|uniref:DUF4013 domain-containing protein n=1 Tax=Methanobacterium alcaliphilum TaxID=392018 RepID=UPI00200ABC9D|nr:DUF4013 domain-containing protein [Methanobacterium alcaliphilum]MCK9151062.1 DUF4013 domain-containing protein [Methanobacterium alcaliphilum]
MYFSEILVDSISYPFTDLKKYFTLLLLFLTSFLIIPGIMACGYLLRIVECSTHRQKEHPDFSDFKKLLMDGLKFLALGIIFGIVFYALLWIINPIISSYIQLDSNFILVIEAVFTIIINSIYIMCLANMAHEKQFKSAFNFKKIFRFISRVGGAKYLALITIFTLLGEVLNLLIKYVTEILKIYTGSYAIGFIVVTLVVYTYLFTFESRFTGLIYPKKLNNSV